MKGLTGSAGAVAVIALGLFPRANGTSLGQEQAEHGQTGSVDAVSPSTNALEGSISRRLQRRGRPRPINDDALDPIGTVSAGTRVTCPHFLRTGPYRGGLSDGALKSVVPLVLYVVRSNHGKFFFVDIAVGRPCSLGTYRRG